MEFILSNIEFFGFFLFLSLFLYFKRKNIDVQGKFPSSYVLLYKTKLGLPLMKKWSKNHPRTFSFLAYYSIFVGVVGALLVIPYFVYQLYVLFQSQIEVVGSFALPLAGDVCSSAVVFCVPFWYWIFALFVLVVVHEFAHGVIAQRYGIKIKSSGLAFFGSSYIIFVLFFLIVIYSFSVDQILGFESGVIKTIITGLILMFLPVMFGAFVEPDEKQMSKKPKWQQIAVLGAGSASNFLFGILFMLILIFLVSPMHSNYHENEELHFASISNQSSLNSYDISSGKVLSLNGNITEVEDIFAYFQSMTPNQSLILEIESQNVTQNVSLATYANAVDSSKGLIGINEISISQDPVAGSEFMAGLSSMLSELLWWLFVFNIGIGIINLLPLWITDGGKIMHLLLSYKLSKENSNKWNNIISLFSLMLLIFLIFPNFLFSLF